MLRLLATGLSNAELADQLTLSEATVKTHVARILSKLGLRDRVQAVVVAYETGLISPAAPADPSPLTNNLCTHIGRGPSTADRCARAQAGPPGTVLRTNQVALAGGQAADQQLHGRAPLAGVQLGGDLHTARSVRHHGPVRAGQPEKQRPGKDDKALFGKDVDSVVTVAVVKDLNGNGVLDAPDVVKDVTGDGRVDARDLRELGVASNVAVLPFRISGAVA